MMSNLMSSRDIERSRSSVTCPRSFIVSAEAKHGNQRRRARKNSIFEPIDRSTPEQQTRIDGIIARIIFETLHKRFIERANIFSFSLSPFFFVFIFEEVKSPFWTKFDILMAAVPAKSSGMEIGK